MISRITGETTFSDLRILPHLPLPESRVIRSQCLSLPGWSGHCLGWHRSDCGTFEVEAITNPYRRIQIVLLAYRLPAVKYLLPQKTPDDARRRAIHEGLIDSELGGQREFSWGEVICRFNATERKDWLVLAFTPGPPVPDFVPEAPLELHAHAPEPG